MAWMMLTCKCGHQADIDQFCRTTISGSLPNGHFQCPACGIAWKRRETEYRIIRSGKEAMIIPGKVEIVTIQSRL